MNSSQDTAVAYSRSGLCVLPADLHGKRPDLAAWKEFQFFPPSESQVLSWFVRPRAMCVLTGSASGHLEMIDFDCGGERFPAWKERVESLAPGLVDKLVIESSQSGGKHVAYRCRTEVPGNRKLAARIVVMPNGELIVIGGKPLLPRRRGDEWIVTVTLIETRGEGGLFLCSPTAGYTLQQGSLTEIPVLSEAERSILIDAACSFDEREPEPVQDQTPMPPCGRPGDDFNERGDVRELLGRHGWQLVRGGDNEYWRRPGKEQGWSATLKDRVFYVFSSNASPFEPDRAYAPFSVYALLEHGGEFCAAAAALGTEGFGMNGSDVDLSRLIGKAERLPIPPSPPEPADPGPIPPELFRIPGFVSEVVDHCLATAPYPNIALAFCGALALQAVLAGRKVRDQADNRTNLYLLALAYSSVGKDWPRKVNASILYRVGLIDSLGDKFASGEGLQDALFLSPAMLFQTDEIDGLLQSINKSRDARYENILGTLLTMYSSANTIYPMRRKAGKESAGVINQPCLVLCGSAIPTHFYAALSERMLTNGFIARTIVVEGGRRGAGQDPGDMTPSDRVLETARWWSEFNPGAGNLGQFHPQPQVVELSPEAAGPLADARLLSETEYQRAEENDDSVGTTIWGRVPEQIRKLALLYAVSENHRAPRISVTAMRWAVDFVLRHTRRMLFMAGAHLAETPFEADCLKVLRKLRSAPEQQLLHSVLLKRMKLDAKTFQQVIQTLEQRGDLSIQSNSTAGRPQRIYQLIASGVESAR